MDMQIDARGQECPLPVVRAKQALDGMEAGSVTVLVDNETAVENLGNLAKSKGFESSSETRGEKEFAVTIVKRAGEAEAAACPATAAAAGPTVVVIGSETMGVGDDALGAVLIKGFVFALTQLDELPAAVLMYNGGVKLACEGSASLDDLRTLAEAGVRVASCGTCLNHFGLTESLQVGEVTNMYDIVETQAQAGRIVRP